MTRPIISAAHIQYTAYGAIAVFLIFGINDLLHSEIWHFCCCNLTVSDSVSLYEKSVIHFIVCQRDQEIKATTVINLGWDQKECKICWKLTNTLQITKLVSLTFYHRNCNSHFKCGNSTTRILGMDLWGLERLHGVKWNQTPILFLRWGLKTKLLMFASTKDNSNALGVSMLQPKCLLPG